MNLPIRIWAIIALIALALQGIFIIVTFFYKGKPTPAWINYTIGILWLIIAASVGFAAFSTRKRPGMT